MRSIFARAALTLQKDDRYEMVDARVWKQVKDEEREFPMRVLEYPPIRIDTEDVREALSGL